ncbi:MAG: hypothetical protein H0T65_20700, partial [Deltaproteobacteria bacterium]|nr:hypothetical protein [Deltaproteobacteria bacterium]
ALPNQPQIKSSPDLSRTVKKAISEVDGLKGLVKTMSGIDLTTDISNATIFVQVPPPRSGQPEMLITVRGKFATATIDRLAKMAGPAVKIGGGAMIELPPGQFPFGAVAVTKDATLLAGSVKAVKDRLADSWKSPARAAGSNLAHAASVLDAKPVAALIMTLSPGARKQAIDELKGQKNFITDVLTRHKLAAISMFQDGVGWTWIDSHKAGLDSMAQISEGAFDMMRAAHVAPRGAAKIMMGALESYRGNKQVDELIKRKADLWKIVESYTGDGNFKVAIDKNPATLRLVARGTGKSLSDVVPAGMLLPGAVLLLVGRSPREPDMKQAAPAPTPVQPPKLSPKPPAPKPAPPRRP